jgi:outer membrane protein OmpA-like peptidoglycan-associated protein
MESGYSHITGTNPLVLESTFVPLTLKAGYNLPVKNGFGVQGNLILGYIFSHTLRYRNAMNQILDRMEEEDKTSPVFGARLYGTWTFPKNLVPDNCLKVYAGGGIDIVNETDGPLPLPLIELGVSFKPFALLTIPKSPKAPPKPKEAPKDKPVEFTHTAENIVIEKTKEGKVVRLLNAVYFEPNTAIMIEKYRHILNAAGERLKADPALRITLRAYAAPFGTKGEREEVSADRGRFCADYLKKNYGIAEFRIRVEYYGAEKSPEFKNASWESYRCVELIIEGK